MKSNIMDFIQINEFISCICTFWFVFTQVSFPLNSISFRVRSSSGSGRALRRPRPVPASQAASAPVFALLSLPSRTRARSDLRPTIPATQTLSRSPLDWPRGVGGINDYKQSLGCVAVPLRHCLYHTKSDAFPE